MNILVSEVNRKAKQVSFTERMLVVEFPDGCELRVPLHWFPRLKTASWSELGNWRLIGEGAGIHWADLDEDLSVAGLLKGLL